MSASPARIGANSFGMSPALYWLSASVLTIRSAPSLRQASSPAWKPAARPLLFVSLTMWSTPFCFATSTVRSVEPSSMISHSTSSTPSISRGRSASVAGSCFSSFQQGIWMMSFMASGVEPRLEHGTTVALSNTVVLPQHPQLAEQRVVSRRVENIAHVALAPPPRLAQHPLLLGGLDARHGGPREHVGAEQYGTRETVECGARHR